MIHKITRVFKIKTHPYSSSVIEKYKFEGRFIKYGKPFPYIFFLYFHTTGEQHMFGVTSFYKKNGDYSFIQNTIKTMGWDGVYINVL